MYIDSKWDLVIVIRIIGKVIIRIRRYWERADVVIVEERISHSDGGVLVVNGFDIIVMLIKNRSQKVSRVERDGGEIVVTG